MSAAAAELIDPQVLRDAQRSLASLPKYDRSGSWRTFLLEFFIWRDVNSIYDAGDQFIKKGPALEMMSSHRAASPTFKNNARWWRYCDAITQIFNPASESQLAKSEFAAYRQAPREDMSTYLSTKYALYDAA